ncbi:MAG: hypothetical protein ACLFTT_01980 [Candidatus Hydrogenedentota bacterium]
MNPILKRQFEQIDAALDDLEAGVKALNSGLAGQRARYEALMQRFWSQGRELAIQKDAAEQAGELRRENKALHEREARVRQGLGRLLEQTKALGADFLS